LSTAVNLTPEQRAAVRRGTMTLSFIHNFGRTVSLDQTINRAVAKFGIDRIVDAVSRAWAASTAPAE
jgi:hypothetical protein